MKFTILFSEIDWRNQQFFLHWVTTEKYDFPQRIIDKFRNIFERLTDGIYDLFAASDCRNLRHLSTNDRYISGCISATDWWYQRLFDPADWWNLQFFLTRIIIIIINERLEHFGIYFNVRLTNSEISSRFIEKILYFSPRLTRRIPDSFFGTDWRTPRLLTSICRNLWLLSTNDQ